MNRESQTRRRIGTAVKLVVGLVLLGAVGGGILLLEQDRSRRLLAEEAKLWTTEEGIIRGVEFLVPSVTRDHWSLLDDATDSLVAANLARTRDVAGGLAPLAQFPNVRELQLTGCQWVVDPQLAEIAKRHRLRSLDLSRTRVTDAGVGQLDLSELHSFKADGCTGLTAETLALLKGLPSLKTVSLKAVPIPFDRYEQFRIARPDVMIVADPLLTWQQVVRRDLSRFQVNWLTDETDPDQFVRYWNLLAKERDVRHLTLAGPGVSRALPDVLARLKTLESLTIVDTRLDRGLDRLPTSVISLALEQLHAGSQLDGLKEITWLRSVDVRHVPLTAEQWTEFSSAIAANKALNRLMLTGVEVPAGSFRKLHDLPELKLLGLYNVQVTDADLQAIGKITSLETLDTNGFPISDAVFESWLDLPNLTYVDVPGDGISPETRERLRQRYPQAHIRFD